MISMKIVFVLVVAVGLILYWIFKTPKSDFKAKPLMTDNEREFFIRLITALPGHHVFPQVAMSAILDTTVSESNKKKHTGLRNKFSQKVVDYIVCDRSMKVVALVELDDKTHSKDKDKDRDALLKKGGYAAESLLRYDSSNKPTIEVIASDIAKIASRQS